MIIFSYDNTFEGVLSAVFDAFVLKKIPDQVLTEDDVIPLLAVEVYQVITTDDKFNRVSHGMKKRLSSIVLNQLTCVWLSESPERGTMIFRYLYHVFKSRQNISTDFADDNVLAIRKLAQKVVHEYRYLMMFVRFNVIENQGDKVYFAVVDPRYNALPLAIDFFKDRFADQKWAIFDSKRQYGYFYDLSKIEIITLDEHDRLVCDGKINDAYLSEEEKQFQKVWYRYCQATTIKERINPKLQRQFMPTRFWKHLPEMEKDKPVG